jgi:hypothetical protein
MLIIATLSLADEFVMSYASMLLGWTVPLTLVNFVEVRTMLRHKY